MSDSNTIEKIYCCDGGNSNNALAAAILANGNNRYGDFGNDWMNNPFAYLMFLALFRNGGFGGFGFDGNGAAAATTQGVEMQAQLNAIRTQLQDNQNADCIKAAIQGNGFALSQLAQILNIDFNTLQKCCCDVQAAIQQVAGQVNYSKEAVIAAIERGNSGLLAAVKDCCCQTQKELIQMAGDIKLQNCQMTGELRNGQRDLGQAITQGFSQSSFQNQQDKCEIIQAITASQQKTADLINGYRSDDQARQIQDLKNQISQLKQTESITAAVFSRLSGFNNGCGCNNGCGTGISY